MTPSFFFFLEQMSSSFDEAISSKEIQIVYGIEGYLSLWLEHVSSRGAIGLGHWMLSKPIG